MRYRRPARFVTRLLAQARPTRVPARRLIDPPGAREPGIVATNGPPRVEAGASVAEHSAAELRPLAMPGLAVIRMTRMIGSDRDSPLPARADHGIAG